MTPVFKSTYSFGKSILTLSDSPVEGGPDSIISICKDNGIKNLVLVEDNLTSFMKAFHVCEKNDLDLIYGLRITMCNDGDEESDSDHKSVIFAKDDEGCKLLNKIYSCAFVEHEGRITYKELSNLWNKDHLSFVVPFYDSFIHKNNFLLKNCIPYLKGLDPKFWIERNNLPFDSLLEKKVVEFVGKEHPTSLVKTIYYKNKDDVEALERSYKEKLEKTASEYEGRINEAEGSLRNMLVDNVATKLANEISTVPDLMSGAISARLTTEIVDGKALTRTGGITLEGNTIVKK